MSHFSKPTHLALQYPIPTAIPLTEERKGMNNPTFPSLPQQPWAGIVLLIASLLSLIAANSTTFAATYFNTLNYPLAGLSLSQWINEGLMSIVFLYFALILKTLLFTRHPHQREQRRLPLLAALMGIILPAVIYLIFNGFTATTLHGWGIPVASDWIVIFTLLVLLGNRVPTALTTFLLTLVITENIITFLLTSALHIPKLSWFYLIAAALVYLVLVVCNMMGKVQHRIYLLGGALLWLLTLKAGLHATVAGIFLAWVLPLSLPDQITPSPVLQWQLCLTHWVALIILPIVMFANLGFALADCSWATLLSPVSFGVALGLLFKPVGIFGTIWLLVKLRWAKLPAEVSLWHILGASLLCGVGLSMSIVMTALTLSDMALQNSSKLAILFCSAFLAFIAYWVLRLAALLRQAT